MTASPEHLARACLILNAGAGQILSTGQEAVERMARAALGETVEIVIAPPESVQDRLERSFADDRFDTIIAGGDGTVSSAGKLALKHDKTLGVLPPVLADEDTLSLTVPPWAGSPSGRWLSVMLRKSKAQQFKPL